MGLLTYAIAGGGFILIGAWEAILPQCVEVRPFIEIPKDTKIDQEKGK